VVPDGTALDEAMKLAQEIAAFPQTALRNDRRSAIEQWDLTTEEAIKNEVRLGIKTVESGETAEGAARFAAGEGRHGGPLTDRKAD
jgi:enoyl-CoA hydratase